jgi:hypothetical protein
MSSQQVILQHFEGGINRVYGYKKISLDEILQKTGEDEELKFMFARQIAPYNIETTLSLLYIKKIIDESGDNVNNIILDILQWGDDEFSFYNKKNRIFVRPQMLYGKKYYIAAQSKSQLDKNIKIKDVYLDVYKIKEIVKRTGLKYMKKSLKYLRKEGKVKDNRVNILDFWGLATLYYIGEVSKDIFGIDKYEIKEFKDKIKLANGDEFDISGYELTFKYKGKELRFRIYDASHIYKEEAKRYEIENNEYIALAVLSGSGYILLEEDPEKPSVDQNIIDFYRKAKKITGYDIKILVVDEGELIKRGIIGKDSYIKLIDKNKNKYIIDTMKEIWNIK